MTDLTSIPTATATATPKRTKRSAKKTVAKKTVDTTINAVAAWATTKAKAKKGDRAMFEAAAGLLNQLASAQAALLANLSPSVLKAVKDRLASLPYGK
jgi:hypothetical protein